MKRNTTKLSLNNYLSYEKKMFEKKNNKQICFNIIHLNDRTRIRSLVVRIEILLFKSEPCTLKVIYTYQRQMHRKFSRKY